MIVHLSAITLDVIMFGTALADFKVLARDDDVGGVGATGPFLAVGAVA